jgi:hypothetical protein
MVSCSVIQISATPSDMGDGLIPMSERSNQTSFMIHMFMRLMLIMMITYIKC